MDLTSKGQDWVDNFQLDLDLPALRCVDPGLTTRFPSSALEILGGDDRLTFIYGSGQLRRIYLDGRHPSEFALNSAMGFSTAHWEGSTLVVETVLLRQTSVGFRGNPISDDTRVVERYTLSEDGNNLSGLMTIHDSENYNKPPLRRKEWKRSATSEIETEPGCDPDSFYTEIYHTGRMQEYLDRADRRF